MPRRKEKTMKVYHPTTIKLHNDHCPHAVELWKQGVKYDRSIFHTGVVAHTVLEKIGQQPEKEPQELADRIVEKYCSKGRAYDKVPEPPSPFEDALRGAKLALEWHARYPVPPADEGVTHEHHFAFDKNWNTVEYYDKNAKFRTMLDVVEIHQEYDESTDQVYTKAVVRDYKTSWIATKNELDSFQRRCQAVVVWLTYKPDIIVLEIANLRTKGIYKKELNMHFEKDTLQEWKDDITLAMKTLDNKLIPNPGMGCIKCPYSPRCQHFDDMYKSEDIIKKYIAAKEIIRNLEPQIKLDTKDQPPKQMALGSVGYITKERKKILPSAKETLLQEWRKQDGTLDNLFAQLDLSVRGIEKIAKILTKNKTDKEELISKLTKLESYASFGIQKVKK